MSSIDLIYNEETGVWEAKKEPYTMIEVASKEDFEYLQKAIAFYDNLVRCRDCKYYNADTRDCGLHSVCMGADDFCSYGFGRTDND